MLTNENQTLKKAVAYTRYSSNNQSDESIEAQKRAIAEFGQREGFEIIKYYIDRAKTATSDKRPEFQKMIKASDRGTFEAVIVHKLDRFARNKYDFANYKNKLKNNGVRVISVLERLDDSPESLILESVIEGMAHYYSANLAREVKKGLVENAYKCKHNGGSAPLGYDVAKDKTYVINEKEAEAVKLIFQMYLEDYTSGNMIKKLNEYGYKTKKGADWTKNSIASIVRNEKYTGTYVYNKSSAKDNYGKRNNHKSKDEKDIIRIENGLPIIIDKETFDKVQLKITERKKTVPSTAKRTYLLAGLVKCSCGRSMHGNVRRAKSRVNSGGKEKPEYVSYRCGNRQKKSSLVCDNPEIRKEYLEDFVLHELEKAVFTDKAIDTLVTKAKEHFEKEEEIKDKVELMLAGEMKEINKKIKNIIQAVTDGFASQELKEEMDNLTLRKSEIEAKLGNILSKSGAAKKDITPEDIRNQLKYLREFILNRDFPEIKTFIKSFVKEIQVSKEGVKLILDPLSSFTGELLNYEVYSSIKREDLYTPLSRKMIVKLREREVS